MPTIPQLEKLLKSNFRFDDRKTVARPDALKIISPDAPYPLGLLLIGPNDDKVLQFYIDRANHKKKYLVSTINPHHDPHFLEIFVDYVPKFWESPRLDNRYKIFHTAEDLNIHWKILKTGSYSEKSHPEEYIIPLDNLGKYI